MTNRLELAAHLEMIARLPQAFSDAEKRAALGLAAEALRDAEKRIEKLEARVARQQEREAS